MSDQLPDPLVPAEVDLRGFSGFMLNVDRLMASELVALGTPEECWAAMMLWCRAWKQTPPGSLPDDERVLRAFSGAGTRWSKVKSMALRGFVKCSDGRLYHRVLCEEVNDAWERRKKFKERSAKANERRWASNHNGAELGASQARSESATSDASSTPQKVQQGVQQGVLEGVQQGSAKDSLGHPVEVTGQDRTGQDFKNLQQRCTEPPPESPTREGAVAVLLRAAGIGKAMSTHPDVIALAETGVSDEQLREAIEQAKVSLKGELPRAAGYLVPIVREILSPPIKAAKSPSTRRAQPEQDFSKLDYSKGF